MYVVLRRSLARYLQHETQESLQMGTIFGRTEMAGAKHQPATIVNSQLYLAEIVLQGVFSTHCLENLRPEMLEPPAELRGYDSESFYSCF